MRAAADAYDNWERLVRATLQKEKLRQAGKGRDRTSGGLAGAVPPSLEKTSNIDAILQAADEIQDDDPNIARIRKFLTSISYVRRFWMNWIQALLIVVEYPI